MHSDNYDGKYYGRDRFEVEEENKFRVQVATLLSKVAHLELVVGKLQEEINELKNRK